MIAGTIAIVAALLSFAVPLVIPLFVQRWRSLAIILVLGAAFFAWLTVDIERASLSGPAGSDSLIGPFLGGLMLFGLGAGAVAKFVMLLGRPRDGAE